MLEPFKELSPGVSKNRAHLWFPSCYQPTQNNPHDPFLSSSMKELPLPSQVFQRQGSAVHRTGGYFLLSVVKAWSLSPQRCSLPLPVYGDKPSSLSTGHAVDGLASGDWLALHSLTKSWILNAAYSSKSVSSCGVPCWASLSSQVKIILLAGRYNTT